MSRRAAAPRIRIGCAGWSIPSRHSPLFGDADSHLARYATRFDIAEINSTFHRPHQAATFERWAASVPARFRFSAKLPRTITHDARLQGVGDALSRFLDQVSGLGPKLGGLLVQLPPSLAFDASVAARFFGMLRRRTTTRIALEPRHASWFTPRADAMMQAFAVSRVAADPAPVPEAARPGGAAAAARWQYWRWHGAPRMYYSQYGDAALHALATQLASATTRTPAWCLFDNTAHGHAMADAARLQAMLGLR
jgi:uncharacterized protein YecE (DUF72 family)